MDKKKYGILFQPGRIGNLEIPNRIAMPPMATNYATEDGFVSDQIRAYYEARAKGGTGLIIVEAISIESPRGNTVVRNLALDDDIYIPALEKFVESLHGHGAKVAAQIFHAGASTSRVVTRGEQPVGPSEVTAFTRERSKALTSSEISGLVQKFAEASLRAKKAGFDAVEIHGGTNYLIAQFLSGYWNKRTDQYGGPLENKARFPLDVIGAVREAVGDDFTVWLRINVTDFGLEDGINIDQAKQVSRWAESAGVNAIHATSFGGVTQPHMGPTVIDHGILLPYAHQIKKVVGVPVIVPGRIDPDQAVEALEKGQADFVAIGRGLIADPEYPKKLAEGRPEDINPCIGCLECINHIIYKRLPMRCAVNAMCGREHDTRIEPSQERKNVVVVGGGPSGMEAARVASLRGHRVTLFEKGSELGGLLHAAAVPYKKEDIRRLIAYHKTQLEKLDVDVRLNQLATPDEVADLKPDAVVIACGAPAAIPAIPGLNHVLVATAEQALLGEAEIGDRVLVIGGGSTGCETAEYLRDQGKAVALADILERIASDMIPILRSPLLHRLRDKGVALYTEVRGEKIEGNRFTFQHSEGKEQVVEADTFVIAAGGKPMRQAWEGLTSRVPRIYFIGDILDPQGGILQAVSEGNRVGRSL
jgi:2,4-dienoyl-CoA reductase-like NADH-dependent reductase (Old Yellow Enzyme family)/thioredoxin reductase